MRKKPQARENEKTTKRLKLSKETLHTLRSPDKSALRHVAGGEGSEKDSFGCCQMK